MKNEVLMELADRWMKDAKEPEIQDGSEEAAISNAEAHGRRQGLRECADALKSLITILG